MIIRPTQQNLVDSIRKIENSPDFAFAIGPDTAWLGAERDEINGRFIDHGTKIEQIQMFGPFRAYAKKTLEEGSYYGPIWKSEIYIYPGGEFTNLGNLTNKFKQEVMGLPSYPQSTLLRYDFDESQQPARDDGVEVVPHIIYFNFDLGYIESIGKNKNYHLEKGSTGDLAKRVLFPPPPHHHWYSMPWIKELAKEKN